MHVDSEGVAMFFHIAAVIITFMIAAVLHTALLRMRGAQRASDLKVWAPLVRRLEPLMPVGAIVILLSGWWLIHLSGGEADWSDGWIASSVGALVVIEAIAGLTLPRRTRALTETIDRADDGPVADGLHQLIFDPVLWYVSHFATVTFFGVVFVMAARPTGLWSPVTILLVSVIVGLLSAVPFVRSHSRSGATRPLGLPPHRVGRTPAG